MTKANERIRRLLRYFLLVAGALTLVGLIFVYSSSSVYALERFGRAHYFLRKQLIFLIPSLGAFFIAALIPLPLWRRLAPIFFIGSLVATMLTFISPLSVRMHGSSRWLNILGMSFQPSEALKLFLFMYMGLLLEKKQQRVLSLFKSYAIFIAILGVSFLVLLKQPDFGSVVTIFSTALVLFFVAEFDLKHLLMTLIVALPIGSVLIYAKAYRMRRIMVFLNPWADPLGKGFQIIQSLIAIGAGNLWGLGVSNSKQKFFYLPMQHTDFIFPIIAEEIGFVGVCLLIMLYILFCFIGIKLAAAMTNEFALFTTLSFVVLITIQAIINIMVTTGLLPTKGLGLPFISYGGSSLLVVFCMLGFIVSCVRDERFAR